MYKGLDKQCTQNYVVLGTPLTRKFMTSQKVVDHPLHKKEVDPDGIQMNYVVYHLRRVPSVDRCIHRDALRLVQNAPNAYEMDTGTVVL